MNKLLIFSRTFPPKVSGAPRVLANLLSQFSPDEFIVFTDQHLLSNVSEEWPNSVLKAQRVIINLPALARRLFSKLNFGQHEFWLAQLRVKKAINIIQEQNITAILGVIPGPEYALSAYLTHLESNLPLFLYYIDTTLPYEGEPVWQRSLLNHYEPLWIKDSKEIFIISEGLAAEMESRQVKSYTVLRHSLLQDMLTLTKTGVQKEQKNEFRIIYPGQVKNNSHLRPIALVIRAIDSLYLERKIKLELLTKASRSSLVAAGLPQSKNWITAFYPPNQVFDQERNADLILVVLDSQSPLRDILLTAFPTKTVEAMVSGVPILLIAPSDSYTARYARSSGFAYVVDDFNVEAIRTAVLRLLTDGELRDKLVSQAWKIARKNHDVRLIADLFRQRVFYSNSKPPQE